MERYLREQQVLAAARERRQAKLQQNQLDKYLEAQRQAQASQQAQQAQQAQAQKQDSDAGFFERVGETIGDVVFDVGYGLLDGIEGIADLGIGLVGAVGGIFDDDFKETMKEAIEYDASYEWIEKHGPDWSDSYLDDDSLVKQIARSVGGMLPSIAVSMIPGAGPGAALGTLGVSAAGSGTQEAYQDGADFYKGLGYGLASGGVEVASEALLGGVTSKVFGGGLINPGNAVAKTGAKRIFKGMAEEAAEEVFASAVNPLAKTIYKGSEALGEYATPEFYKGLAESAIAGAGAAGAIGAFTGDFTKKRDVAASMEAAKELRNKRAELFNEDTLTEEADTNIRESVEANLAKVENILKKMSAEKRAKVIKEERLENLFEEDGSMRENAARAVLGEQVPTEGQEGAQSVFDASHQRYVSPALWNQQQRVNEELAQITEDLRTAKNNPEIADVKVYQGELSDTERPAFKQIKKAMAALSKRTAKGLNFVITEASPDYSGVLPGKSNTVYITKDTLENGTWAKSLVHEIMHYNEGTREYNKLLSVLTSDAKSFEKTVAALTQEGNPYGFTAELYDSMSAKLESGTELTEDEQSLRNEMGARLAEELLGNERFIERIAQTDASLARRIFAKIRDLLEAFRTLGNKEARAEYKRLKAVEKLYLNAIESSGYNRLADEITEEIVKRGEEREESMKSSNTDGRFGMGELIQDESQFSLDYKPTPKDPDTAYIVEGWGEDTDTDTEQAQKPAKKPTEEERKASIALAEENERRRNFNYTEGQRARDYAEENTNKVYTKDDASAIVSSILADRMNFGEVYGSLRGQSRNKIVETLWKRMNSTEAGNRARLALNAAEYIIQSAVVEDALYDPMNDYYRDVVEMLRPYVRKLNLSGLNGEIKHRYGKDTKRIYSRWNKRNGISPDVAAQELAGLGYQIDATNPADILFEIEDAYQKATKAIDDRAKTLLRDTLSVEEHNELKQEIARDILISFDTHGSESKLAKFKNEHEKSMQMMRKRIDAANERTRLSREQAKIDVQAAEDKAKRAREEARETEARAKEMNRVIYQLEKARDLKKGTYHNHAEFKEDKFEKSIGQLGGLLMQGNLKQVQARTVAKDLLEWYTPDNKLLEPADPNANELENPHSFKEDIRQKIETIANGTGIFTSQELRTFAQVVGYFNHFVESFDKVYKNGKYVEARAIAERYVEKLKAAKKKRFWQISRWFESGYAKTFSDPLSLMKYADKYDPNGFFTETFRELEKGAVGAAVTEMELLEKYNKFFKDHKGYEKRLEKETVDYNNVKINVDAAICLYMTSKVDDAWKGLVKSGATLFVDGKSQELAELLKEDGEITDAEIETLVEEMRSKLRDSFTKEDLAFIETMEKILNEDCSKLKVDTDEARLGYSNVMEKYYFPLMRADVARTVDKESFFDGVNRVSNLSMNKDRAKGASGRLGILRATEVLQRHIRQIAMYSNLAIPIDNYNRLVNLNVGDNAGAPDSVASNLKGGDKDFYAQAEGYLKDLINDMQGRPSRSDTRWYNHTVSKIRGGYAKFQLGANTKTWLTQLSSFIAASNVLDYSSIVKGMAIKGKFDEVDKYCKLAQHRNTENTVVKAQGVIDKTGKLGDVLMTPIGWVDRVVVVELFGACQVQVEADGGAKIGTEENKIAAGELLERVILETQQNSVLTGKSAAMRSGDELLKSLTMFSSDSMKIFGRFMDAQGERLAIKYELKNNKDMTSEERKAMEARLKTANKQIGKATTAMVASAVFMAMLGLLFRTIRRKNKDKDAEEIAWETAFDGVGNMLGGLPIIRDIYSAFSDGYEMENFAFAVLNDAVEATNATISLAQKAASGTPVSKQEVATSIRKLIYSAGQMLGIPTRNLFNTASSITGMISNSGGYYIDDLFYKQPYKADLKKAVEDGDERMIATITGLMIDEKVTTESEAVRGSMRTLIEKDYSVLPKTVGDTITHDGEEIELSADEKRSFEKIYSAADQAVEKLVELSQFKEADEEAQAKAMRLIWDTYYNLARDEVLGIETETKNVLFAEAIDIEKLAMIASVARSIKADKDRTGKEISGSRKKKITEYIESLRLSAAEKYMIMGYLGYSNVHGESQVKSYIGKLDLSSEEKKKLLEYSGYKKEA